MLVIPVDTARSDNTFLTQCAILPQTRAHYHKWLRYYLDFCHRYPFDAADKNSFSAFNRKLSEKGQSESLSGTLNTRESKKTHPKLKGIRTGKTTSEAMALRVSVTPKAAQRGAAVQSTNKRRTASPNEPRANKGIVTGASWVWVYDTLEPAIKVRHYSAKTLQA